MLRTIIAGTARNFVFLAIWTAAALAACGFPNL